MSRYHLEKDGSFVIQDYNRAKTFASFFPGIAGLFGIPLWVFYVNRGQCIASAGIRSKDEAIMEFLPANKAYQYTTAQGFRTFIKVKNQKNAFYEPFSLDAAPANPSIKNKMVIRPFDLRIIETNTSLGLQVEVSYFSVPHEPWAALVRELTIKNISKKQLDIEFLDGLSILVPYGVNNWFLKEMGRTIEAWMEVENLNEGVPLYKLSTDPRDSAQVAFIKGAHFYLGFEENKTPAATKIIVDPEVIFNHVTDLSAPSAFMNAKSFVYPKHQVAKNKTPCAFSLVRASLKKGQQTKFISCIGHVFDAQDIKRYKIVSIDRDFIGLKRRQNQELIEGIADRMFTASAFEVFDGYARQTHLDNVLRGGMPMTLAATGAAKCQYVFSRKHGDLERDYNRFFVPSTYFSEGEGNYRDVNQNRRSDCFFNPDVGEQTIVDFMNLIQLDGFNPLIFKGRRLEVAPDIFESSGLAGLFHEKEAKKIRNIISKPFSLAELFSYILENKVVLSCSKEELVSRLLEVACATTEAVFQEGYWSDHWTYNTDLLESFYSIFPDRMKKLLLGKDDFTFFDTHVFVKPRAERYSIQHGEVRQYHAIFSDEKKNALIHSRQKDRHKVRVQDGQEGILKTTLLEKFLCLIVNKLATLDPCGAGIEMEADKPNWYDALNGLPGLLGSSISETFELKRLIMTLKRYFQELKIADTDEVVLVPEIFDFIVAVRALLEIPMNDFDYWDQSNALKESFRLKTRLGVAAGPSRKMSISQIKEFFDLALNKLNAGIKKSFFGEDGLFCTYFTYRMIRHESGPEISGRHSVVAKEFQQEKLPLFLEGFVHAMRTEKSKISVIHASVKKSPLWDRKLKMYKVNASLAEESFEIGRAKAFAPGWLENESIWLHMEYKYILELLKNNMHEEFYDDFFHALIAFQDPKVYGRSILETSSFIASSAHPDVSLHGRGFVARLSGSTAEFIHMWLLMNMGPEPFFLDTEDKLALRFRPGLCAKLFTKKPLSRVYKDRTGVAVTLSAAQRSYSFLLLGKTLVTYLNPGLGDTFGDKGVSVQCITLFDKKGKVKEFKGCVVSAPFAQRIRDGAIDRIEIHLGR